MDCGLAGIELEVVKLEMEVRREICQDVVEEGEGGRGLRGGGNGRLRQMAGVALQARCDAEWHGLIGKKLLVKLAFLILEGGGDGGVAAGVLLIALPPI